MRELVVVFDIPLYVTFRQVAIIPILTLLLDGLPYRIIRSSGCLNCNIMHQDIITLGCRKSLFSSRRPGVDVAFSYPAEH
ncbi:hypothetical protein E4U30_008372, partial [Claviceps sp. LM220 group G6]